MTTNEEWLKSLPTEELAEFGANYGCIQFFEKKGTLEECSINCVECFKAWLKRERTE